MNEGNPQRTHVIEDEKTGRKLSITAIVTNPDGSEGIVTPSFVPLVESDLKKWAEYVFALSRLGDRLEIDEHGR